VTLAHLRIHVIIQSMRLPKFLTRFAATPVVTQPSSFYFADALRDYDDPSAKPVTESQAMRVPAYAACVRILSDSIAQMPLRLRRKTDDGAEDVTDHPTIRVLRDPDPKRPALTGQALIKGVTQSMVIHGNGYLEQVRVNRGAKLFSLKPIAPERVQLCLDDMDEIVYRVDASTIMAGKTRQQRELKAPDILHFRGTYADSEGYLGIGSLITMRDLLRASIEQLQHAKRSLIGGNLKGFLTYDDANLTAEQIKAAQDILNDPNADNKWKAMPGNPTVTFPPGDNQRAQFVESRRAQVAEYARAFGVPNHLIMDVAGVNHWGSGLSEQGAGFVRYTLQPLAQSIENALDQNLLTDVERDDGLFFEFDFRSFLRGTPNQRADYYAKGIAAGWLSPCQARQMEGLPADDECDGGYKPVAEVKPPEGAPPAGMRPPNQPADPEE